MPVFKNGKKNAPARWKPESQLEINRTRPRRNFIPREHFPYESNKLDTVCNHLRFSIPAFVSMRRKQNPNQKIRILDWGCGTGQAAHEIAQSFGGACDVIGYSKDHYNEWTKRNGVRFIQATAEQLPRYIRKETVDLIFSDMGLMHVNPIDYPNRIPELLQMLRQGGILVFNSNTWRKKQTDWKKIAGKSFLVKKINLKHDREVYVFIRRN